MLDLLPSECYLGHHQVRFLNLGSWAVLRCVWSLTAAMLDLLPLGCYFQHRHGCFLNIGC